MVARVPICELETTSRADHPEMRFWAFSTRAQKSYVDADFEAGDGLLFGPETRGLPVADTG